MPTDKTERKQEIDRLLNELAKSTSPEVEFMLKMFELQYEDVKDRLVEARGEEVAIIQGEARYLRAFHRQFAAAHAMLRRKP